jgi:hypothetical protein
MNNVSLLIKDSFDVITLFLVFVLVLFDIRYPQIQKELNKKIPDKILTSERMFLRKELISCLLQKSLPLIILYGILLYLFIPLFFQVISTSKFQIWNFDILPTAFIFIILLIAIFWGWSIDMAIMLIKNIRDSK